MESVGGEVSSRVSCMSCLRRLLLGCFCLGLAGVGFGMGFVGVIYSYYAKGLPDISLLEAYRPAQTTTILAADGTVIATLFKENRVWVPLGDISPFVVQALLATEDSRFYTHFGVDPVGVLRAVWVAFREGRPREGASTITMQLARNLFLTNKPTLSRKIKESILALRIERRFSKQKILELYLNQVYFGSGAYGIYSAAKLYFGVSPQELTPAQAALLVGLLQAPSLYSPLVHREAAVRRQKVVLRRMLKLNYLTRQQYEQALREADTTKYSGTAYKHLGVFKYPYFSDYLVHMLARRYEHDLLYQGGLTVFSTVDPRLQARAEKTLQRYIRERGKLLNAHTGALVMLDNDTGFVVAMVGGTGWSVKNQFNRAWQAHRQPGSSFKTIVYACAIESGYSQDSIVWDTPVEYNGWKPHNSDGKYLGRMTLRKALALSRNVVAVKLVEAVGPDRVISLAYRMGIRSKISPNLSIALGAVDATPLEMAQVFSVYATGGVYRAPVTVMLVQDSAGNIVEDNRKRKGERVLRRDTALRMLGMLQDVVRYGTGTRAAVPGWQIAGKTGTTDRFRDAWFVGCSPYYTLAVWVGNDDNSSMWRSYGGDLPASIFREVMRYALQGKLKRSFPPEPPPKKQRIDMRENNTSGAVVDSVGEGSLKTDLEGEDVPVPIPSVTPIPYDF